MGKSKSENNNFEKVIVIIACVLLVGVLAVVVAIRFSRVNKEDEPDRLLSTEELISVNSPMTAEEAFSLNGVSIHNLPILEFSGEPWVEVNGGMPFYIAADIPSTGLERYDALDELGRCGTVYACIGSETTPTEERGEIGHIKPSGWNQAKYFGVVNSKPPYLYNRCHLIAYCLTGENANEMNLITGTRYMNVEGMLPWEIKVANYVDETNNHVMYRVTPDFRGDELLARGVLIEAYSIEDKGYGICFCVYCYNVQPGVVIDYMTGESWLKE